MSKFCPSCGEELIDNAKFCKNCGMNLETKEENPYPKEEINQQFSVPTVENDHKIAVILGYALAILIPFFGIIVGIYLITRKDSENAKKHAKYVLVLSVVIWLLSIIFFR